MLEAITKVLVYHLHFVGKPFSTHKWTMMFIESNQARRFPGFLIPATGAL